MGRRRSRCGPGAGRWGWRRGGGSGTTTLTGVNAANDVSFSSTVNGAQALSITAGGGDVSFGGAVGGTTALASVSVNCSAITLRSVITNGGIQSYTGAVTLGAAATLDTTNGGASPAGATNTAA